MRHPDIIRPIKLTTTLPEDVKAKLDLHLFSEVAGRVPIGAYQKFFLERIKDFFYEKTLDISEYLDSPVGCVTIKGGPAALEAVKTILERHNGN
jgi:hypothetical protein